jgi:predicted DNA-binding protein
MTLQIELSPDVEERLKGEASRQGITEHEYARLLIEQHLPGLGESNWDALEPEEWVRTFDEWVRGHDYITAPPLSTDALRREHLCV